MKTTISMTVDEWGEIAPKLATSPEHGLMAQFFIAGGKKIKATFEVVEE